MVYSINHLFRDFMIKREVRHYAIHAETERFINTGLADHVTMPRIPRWDAANRPNADRHAVAIASHCFWMRALDQVGTIEEKFGQC